MITKKMLDAYQDAALRTADHGGDWRAICQAGLEAALAAAEPPAEAPTRDDVMVAMSEIFGPQDPLVSQLGKAADYVRSLVSAAVSAKEKELQALSKDYGDLLKQSNEHEARVAELEARPAFELPNMVDLDSACRRHGFSVTSAEALLNWIGELAKRPGPAAVQWSEEYAAALYQEYERQLLAHDGIYLRAMMAAGLKVFGPTTPNVPGELGGLDAESALLLIEQRRLLETERDAVLARVSKIDADYMKLLDRASTQGAVLSERAEAAESELDDIKARLTAARKACEELRDKQEPHVKQEDHPDRNLPSYRMGKRDGLNFAVCALGDTAEPAADRNNGRSCLCGADLSEPGSRLHHYCRFTNGGEPAPQPVEPSKQPPYGRFYDEPVPETAKQQASLEALEALQRQVRLLDRAVRHMADMTHVESVDDIMDELDTDAAGEAGEGKWT